MAETPAPIVTETTLGKGGSLSLEASGLASATRTWQIQFAAIPSTLAAIEATPGLPTLRSELPSDTLTPKRILKGMSIKPADQTKLLWSVEGKYEQPEAGETDADPLERPDEVTFDASKESEEIFEDEGIEEGGDEDRDPKPIVNSADEVFEKLYERTTGALRLVIEGNRATFDAAMVATYLKPNAVNAGSFTVRGIMVGAGEGKLVGFNAKPTKEGAYFFWRLRWEIELSPDWDLYVDDRGFNEKDDDGKLREIIKGKPPVKPDKPWPLTGVGVAAATPDIAPAELHFRTQPRRDFSVFEWTEDAYE